MGRVGGHIVRIERVSAGASRTRVVQGTGGLDRARTYAGEAAEEAGVPRAALRAAGWLCVQRE